MATKKETPPGISESGDRFWRLRVQLGQTQDELAKKAGVDRVVISRIENGGNKLSTGSLQRSVAAAFGVSVETLLAYLEGDLALEELLRLRRADGTEAGVPSFGLRPDKYPSRSRIIRAARVARISETLVSQLEEEEHETDPGRRHWLRRLSQLCLVDSELPTPGTFPPSPDPGNPGAKPSSSKSSRKIR